MTNITQDKSVTIVTTGMHRSGTSLTASLLQSAGVNIGEHLMGGEQGNPKGHFEDLDFVEFHRNILQSQGISTAGWTDKNSVEVQRQYIELATDLISQKAECKLWGWKDPRTVLFLDFWSELIPAAKYVFVYRSPWETIDSLFRRGDIIFQTNPNFALTQWCNYNQKILDFYQSHNEQCLLFDLASITEKPETLTSAIAQKWQIELTLSPEICDPSLLTNQYRDNYRQALIAKFFPQAIELYEKLQQQSDFSSSDLESVAVDATCQSWILQDWLDIRDMARTQQLTANHADNLERMLEETKAQLAPAQHQLATTSEQLEISNAELTQTQQQLVATNEQLAAKNEQLAATNEQLAAKNEQLAATNQQLEEVKNKLTKAQHQLDTSEAELLQSQKQLQEVSPELIKYQQHAQHFENKFNETTRQVQIAQMQADRYKLLITAMETSKFWQLRRWWIGFKQKNGMGSSDLLYQTYLLSNQPKPSFPNTAAQKEDPHSLMADTPEYKQWLDRRYPKPDDLRAIRQHCQSLEYQPLISAIMPVYNPDEDFLRQAIDSVIEQVYDNWELCIADDCSTKSYVKNVLKEYAQRDSRIKLVFRQENGHICNCSNSALELATGEYIALLDHDDRLAPHALARVVETLNRHPEADFIYSDEDKIDDENIHRDHFFKPDWCPDSFLSRMYTCHLGVYRRSLVNEIGKFRVGFEGSQDYDLVLRLTEKTDKIFHIPDVLYHWRIHLKSTAGGSEAKPYATNAAQKALAEALERRNQPGKVVCDPERPGIYRIRYQIPEAKKVSIIIPTKDLADVLDVCLKSIFDLTTYPNYEVVVIDNGSTEVKTQKCFDRWRKQEPDRFKCYAYDVPFNYSQINNYGASQAQGDYLLLLNNDTKVVTPDWLEAMVEQVQRPTIGAVGAMLLYPDDTIQHAGVVLGLGGVAGHSHKHFPVNHPGYISQLVAINNYSAVTGACLMCRREVFEEVGGLEENLAIAFNDVDFCLKVVSRGYRNIHLPHVVLYHYESKSRGYEDTPKKQARFAQEVNYMRQKWHQLCDSDPCYNPNLTRCREDYSLNI